MDKRQQKETIERAAEELACLIEELNELDKSSSYDFKTCYELMVLAKEL